MILKFFKKIVVVFFMFTNSLIPQQTLDKIVAIVDNDIILQSELMQYTLNLAVQMKVDPRLETEKFEELQQEVLANMINQKILLLIISRVFQKKS